MSRPKKGKAKMYAVINRQGYICCNLVRNTKTECVKAHEQMTGSPWYYYTEVGFSIKRVKLEVVI